MNFEFSLTLLQRWELAVRGADKLSAIGGAADPEMVSAVRQLQESLTRTTADLLGVEDDGVAEHCYQLMTNWRNEAEFGTRPLVYSSYPTLLRSIRAESLRDIAAYISEL